MLSVKPHGWQSLAGYEENTLLVNLQESCLVIGLFLFCYFSKC